MPQPDSIPALNRLMALLSRSFPQYLVYARPYITSGSDEKIETFVQIADDQTALRDRVASLIDQADAYVDTGAFPAEFASTHDVSIDYAVKLAIDHQTRDIAEIDDLLGDLRLAPAARSLAEEALGMARGHLESLQELAKGPA